MDEITVSEIRERFKSDEFAISESRLTCPNGADYYVFCGFMLDILAEDDTWEKHTSAEEPGDLCWSEVTGLHAYDDLDKIDELTKRVQCLDTFNIKLGVNV